MSTPPTNILSGGERQRTQVLTVLMNTLIVSALLLCVVAAVMQFGLQFVPDWNTSYIPTVCLVLTLEVTISTRYLHARRARLPVPWYVVRAVEAGLMVLALRSVLGLMRGPDFVIQAMPNYHGIDTEVLALVAIGGLIWLLGWQFTGCLIDLESGEPGLDREVRLDLDRSQQAARQSLVAMISFLGALLVLINAILRLSLRNTGQDDAAAQLSVTHILIFFVLGLILLSATRLILLRSGWQWERIPIGPGVALRWLGYGVALIAALLLIAIVLPTRYSLNLLGTLSYLLSLLIALAQFIWLALGALLSALIRLLFPQLDSGPTQLPDLPPLLQLPATPDTPPTISEFVQSLIFWLVLAAMLIYLIRQYARQHPTFEGVLRRLPGWSMLSRWWRWLRAALGGFGAKIAAALETRRQLRSASPARSGSPSNRWLNARHLSPRNQVRFYYQALLRRGGERGYPRGAAQTPHEYARDLATTVPEVDRDVAAMTDQFVEARYSRHDITPDRVGIVRRAWAHIKQALRRR